MEDKLTKEKLEKEFSTEVEKELIDLRVRQCKGGYPAFLAERRSSMKLNHMVMKKTGVSFSNASEFIWGLIKGQREDCCKLQKLEKNEVKEFKSKKELIKENNKVEKSKENVIDNPEVKIEEEIIDKAEVKKEVEEKQY